MRTEEGFDRLQKSAESGLEIARSWENKRNLLWAARVYESAIGDLYAIAVGKYPDAESAKQYLTEQSIIPLLLKLSSLQQSLLAEVEAGRVPADEFSGNYISLALSHLCCVVGDYALAWDYARRAFHPEILSTSTNFWHDYARGYRCLWEKLPYQKGTFPTLRHSESYWLPYMDLMEAASTGASLDAALAAIDDSFKKRNEDKRVKDDSYMLDGSPYFPVRWNFRRDGLLGLIRYLGC
jgi:hypothetical protein